MNPQVTFDAIQAVAGSVKGLGAVYEFFLVAVAIAIALIALAPAAAHWRTFAITALAAVLLGGEAALMWFHWRLYELAVVVDPSADAITGRVAVPLWVESEKLFVWALAVAILGTLMRRQRRELMSGVMLIAALLTASAGLLGKPFTEPLPNFFGQYVGYLQAMAYGGQAALGAFEGMESARQFYYNAWYMWVHPPLLFASYACFTVSFVATVQMIRHRHSSFETTAYRWARLGYLLLTFGMLLGFPWALAAWQGDSWWWSGKVNMSLMMWLLYTAVLHARLYLRRAGMWKAVALLGVLSFLILVLTYITTYVVPGAHSYALGSDAAVRALVSLAVGGVG